MRICILHTILLRNIFHFETCERLAFVDDSVSAVITVKMRSVCVFLNDLCKVNERRVNDGMITYLRKCLAGETSHFVFGLAHSDYYALVQRVFREELIQPCYGLLICKERSG